MGMGPLLSVPKELFERLPAVLADSGIRCSLEVPRGSVAARQLRFRRRVASAEADVGVTDPDTVRLHIVCTHTFNPLMWWSEVRLVNDLERLLLQNGASPCSVEDFFGGEGQRNDSIDL